MAVYIGLKPYLTNLEIQENLKPTGERRVVPSVAELARSIGVHQTTLSRIANNDVGAITLDTANKLLNEMNRRGFPMRVTDLIVYIPDEIPSNSSTA